MSSPSRPQTIPSANDSNLQPPRSSVDQSNATARLASPVPSFNSGRRLSPGQKSPEHAPPLAGLDGTRGARSLGQPGPSALAEALSSSIGKSLPKPTVNKPQESAHLRSASVASRRAPSGTYGSFTPGSYRTNRPSETHSPAPFEDFDVVRKHLAGPLQEPNESDQEGTGVRKEENNEEAVPGHTSQKVTDASDAPDLTGGFSSLQLQGGDVHREIYRRTEAEELSRRRRNQRSQSVDILRPAQMINVESILQPGGFRREHILRTQPDAYNQGLDVDGGTPGTLSPANRRNFLTSNFFEFLSLYGHFAGEDYEDDDSDREFESDATGIDDSYSHSSRAETDESRPLLKRKQSKRKKKDERKKNGTMGTVLILLKSFVGTGVLFLPRAFLNGGMAFSLVVLVLVSALSYYCFLLLTTSRLKLKSSYSEMGDMVYGGWMRTLINSSLVISQVGFASAYIVFTSENLRAFVLAVSHCKTDIDIKLMILMQLIVFLPLSLYRNLASLSFVVYIADIFIVLGLVYLYFYGIATIIEYGGVADIALFNKDSWSLFIGTAIFTFEGIGLIIPIQDGMKKPQQLPSILLGVMILITIIFVSMGALSYAAYGSKTQTVIIKNMEQDNKFVNAVQFIYSLAILLSTPMQIFPAITILEKSIFSKSGKFSKNIKWGKNVFRFGMVLLCALIAWVGANDLDKFVALVGSFACIPLVYIYPPLIHRKAITDSRLKGLIDLVLVIFGIVLMVYTSALTIISWVGASNRGGNESFYCPWPPIGHPSNSSALVWRDECQSICADGRNPQFELFHPLEQKHHTATLRNSGITISSSSLFPHVADFVRMSVDSAHAANSLSSTQHDIGRTVLRRKRKLTELYAVSTSDQPLPTLSNASSHTDLFNFLDRNDIRKRRYFHGTTLPSRRKDAFHRVTDYRPIVTESGQAAQPKNTRLDSLNVTKPQPSRNDPLVLEPDRGEATGDQNAVDVNCLRSPLVTQSERADYQLATKEDRVSANVIRNEHTGGSPTPFTRKGRPAKLHSPPYSPGTSSDGQDTVHLGTDGVPDPELNILTPHHDSHDEESSERVASVNEDEAKELSEPQEGFAKGCRRDADPGVVVGNVLPLPPVVQTLSNPAWPDAQSSGTSTLGAGSDQLDAHAITDVSRATAIQKPPLPRSKASSFVINEAEGDVLQSLDTSLTRSTLSTCRDVLPDDVRQGQRASTFASDEKGFETPGKPMIIDRLRSDPAASKWEVDRRKHCHQARVKKSGRPTDIRAVTVFPTRQYERWRRRCRMIKGYELVRSGVHYLSPLAVHYAIRQSDNQDLKVLLDNRVKVLTTAEREIQNSEHLSRLTLMRVKALQDSDRWLLRQRKPAAEPDRSESFWDCLIQDAKSSRTDFREERKLKICIASLLAQWCAQYVAASAEQRTRLRSRAGLPTPSSRISWEFELEEPGVFSENFFKGTPIQIPETVLNKIPSCRLSRAPTRPAALGVAVFNQAISASQLKYKNYNRVEEDQEIMHEIPAEDTSCALFAPESKSLKRKMNIPSIFKPPNRTLGMGLPPQGFYETRLPSHWTYDEDSDLKRLMKEYPANWMLISQLLTPKSDFTTAAERRTPWECYERLYMLESQPSVDLQQRTLVKPLLQKLDQAQKAFEEQQRQFQSQVQQARENGQPTTSFLQKPFPVPRRVERKQNRRFAALAQAASRLARKRETAISKQEKSQQAEAHAPKPQPPRHEISHDPKYYSERKRAVEVQQADKIQERRRADVKPQQMMEMQRRQQAGYPAALTHGIGQQMQNGMVGSQTATNGHLAVPSTHQQSRAGQLQTGARGILPNGVNAGGQTAVGTRSVSALPNQRLMAPMSGHTQDNMALYMQQQQQQQQQQAIQQRYQNSQQKSQAQQSQMIRGSPNGSNAATLSTMPGQQFSSAMEVSPILRQTQQNGSTSHSPPHAQHAMAAAAGLAHPGIYSNHQPQALSSGQVPQLVALVHEIQKQNPQLSDEQAREQATNRLKSFTRQNAMHSATGTSVTQGQGQGKGQGQQHHQSNGNSQSPYQHSAPTPQMQNPYQQNGGIGSGRQHSSHHGGIPTQQQYQQAIWQQMHAQRHNLPQSGNSSHASPSPHMAHLGPGYGGTGNRTGTTGGYSMRPPSRNVASGYEVQGYGHHEQRPGSATSAAQSPRPISAQGFTG